MNYLSRQNNFLKPRSGGTFLTDLPFKNTYFSETRASLTNNNPSKFTASDKKLEEVWSKDNFDTGKVKVEPVSSFANNVKTTWALEATMEENKCNLPDETTPVKKEGPPIDREDSSPSHHARRPPNAFLIFCKKHRPIVRQKFPNLENRGVTKILGEWWALLEAEEKQPYNDLAREYKDAFLSANPDFRWYKLPAPPLRTLTPRPATISKTAIPASSPTSPSEFTPGKLADESQLGGLTSLMNNNFTSAPKTDCCKLEDNNNYASPTNTIRPSLPPKPIKKRIFEQYIDNKECSRAVLDEERDMTNQDLLDKVVDGIFAKDVDKEPRKSDRMCKGKRYERFMVEGKLLGNKRDAKLTQQKQCKHDFDATNKHETPKFDLDDTIKRLAKRTNVKIDLDDGHIEKKRPRSTSETSDSAPKDPPTANFNLDLRIANMPSLSYDGFLTRKRESKKRKIRVRTDGETRNKTSKMENQLIGSKKRKNKHSITHLNKNEEDISVDLLGLATLAMVAANTEKITPE